MNTEHESESQELEVIQPTALESMERASIDIQIATAKRYPRSIDKVRRNMERFATMDQETAESCFYVLKRKGEGGKEKVIQGPSVRLAEIAVACYQNLRASTRIVANDGKTLTAQGICHDLENNICIGWETKRRITNRSGQTYSEDMQVVAGNAASAIAFRNAVFKVIPGALISPVYEKCKEVAIGNAKSLAERRDKAIAKFTKMGVSQGKILQFLGKSDVADIDIADLETLFGVFTAIKDGTTTIDEQFVDAAPSVPPLVKEEAATPKTATAPEAPPQDQLQSFVEGSGFDWPTFKVWADGTGNMPDGAAWATWTDIPDADAKRFLRSQAGLKKGLADVKVAAV